MTKLDAVKIVRAALDIGLKQSKDLVEHKHATLDPADRLKNDSLGVYVTAGQVAELLYDAQAWKKAFAPED